MLANDESWRLRPGHCEGASYLLDGRGNTVWSSPYDRYAQPVDWPTACGPQALLAKPHVADPEDARPFIMDGAGTLLAQFPIPPRLPRFCDYALPHSRPVWGDWGDYYGMRCVNLDGRGARLVIWSRRDLWVFAPETA